MSAIGIPALLLAAFAAQGQQGPILWPVTGPSQEQEEKESPELDPLPRSGLRLTLEADGIDTELEATTAAGNALDINDPDDFNGDMETTIQHGAAFVTLGWTFQSGFTLFGRVGTAIADIEQEIGAGSVLGPPARTQGDSVDAFTAIGAGVSFRGRVGFNSFVLLSLTWSEGEGDLEDFRFQDRQGDGDYTFSRLAGQFGLGFDVGPLLYVAARYDLLVIELTLADPGGDRFEVEFENENPLQGVLGITHASSAEKIRWRIQAGVGEGISVELRIGFML